MSLKATLNRLRVRVRSWLCSRHDRSMQEAYLDGLTWAEQEMDRGLPPDAVLMQAGAFADSMDDLLDDYAIQFDRGARDAGLRRINRTRLASLSKRGVGQRE